MKLIGKIGIGLAVLTLGIVLTSNASKLQAITQKFKINVGIPQKPSVSGGVVSLVLNRLELTNQSNITASIKNLFVTIQVQKDGIWQDLLTQKNAMAPFDVKAYGTQSLPNITLTMPLTSATTLPGLLLKNYPIKVITRFTSGGFEYPLETLVDTRTYLQPIIDIVTNPFGLFSLN